jgi:hypothetical protein
MINMMLFIPHYLVNSKTFRSFVSRTRDADRYFLLHHNATPSKKDEEKLGS